MADTCSMQQHNNNNGGVFRTVHDVFHNLFLHRQGNRSVRSYYSTFTKLMDELELYHPRTDDVELLKRQRDEFIIAKFLTGLNPMLRDEKFHLLGNEPNPSLIHVYSRAILVSVSHSDSYPPPDDVFGTTCHGDYGHAGNSNRGGRGGYGGGGGSCNTNSASEGFSTNDSNPVDIVGNHGGGGGNTCRGDYGGRGGGNSNRGGRGGRGRGGVFGRGGTPRYCTHCNRTSHNIDQCYYLHGFPSQYQPSSSSSTATTTSAAKSGFGTNKEQQPKFEAVNKEQKSNRVPPSPPSAASVAAQEACENWRLRANECYNKGDLDKADDYYTSGVNSVSKSETSRSCLKALMLCYSNRAATRMALERMREAIEDCKLASVIDPNFLKVHLRAAKCYLSMGEVEEALQCFKKCLPSDVSVDNKIKEEALEGLQKAQKVSECINKSAELIRRRTSTDAESALSDIAEALIISPHSEKILEMKAEAHSLLRKYEEVIKLCEESLHFAERNCLPVRGDSQAENLNSSVLPKSFMFKNWRFSLIVKSYFNLGKFVEAQDFVEKQNELRNGNKALKSSMPVAVIQILELLSHKEAGNEAFKSGRHEEAIKHYTDALSSNVDSRPFAAICFGNRAAAYMSLNRITDAIADCSLAIALDTEYFKALSRRASLYEMIKAYGQAASDLQRLVSSLTKQAEEKINQSGSTNDIRQAKLRLSEMERKVREETPLNMYLILGITSSVQASGIKAAYKKAALKHHPDKASKSLARNNNGDEGLWKEIAEEVYKDADKLFKMIGEAYAVLSNPIKRAMYDLNQEMDSKSD